MDGAGGDDELEISAGDDSYIGGPGADRLSDNEARPVTKIPERPGFDLDLGAGKADKDGYGGRDTVGGIENVWVDRFGTIRGDAGPNVINASQADVYGGAGDDTIHGTNGHLHGVPETT